MKTIQTRTKIAIAAFVVIAVITTGHVSTSYAMTAPSDEYPTTYYDPFPYVGIHPYYGELGFDGDIDVTKILLSSIKTDYVQAATIAKAQIENGYIISGNIEVFQGYLVYIFYVMDSDKRSHQVVVDAGDGKVIEVPSYEVMPYYGMDAIPEIARPMDGVDVGVDWQEIFSQITPGITLENQSDSLE